MRAMEGAEAQMDNADVGIERSGGRQGRPGGHVPQGAVGKAFHPYCLELLIAHHIRYLSSQSCSRGGFLPM